MTWISVLIAFVANAIAYKQGYYRLAKSSPKTAPLIQNHDLGICFAIYLVFSLLLTPLLAKSILMLLHRYSPEFTSLPIGLLTFLYAINMVIVFVFLQLYIYHRDSILFGRIWKDRQHKPKRPIEFDLGIGALTWILSFPVVAILSDLFDRFFKLLFGNRAYEQIAVQLVKIASASPMALVFALLCVLVLAPLTEELLFRGLLQTHLKKRVGSKAAILISALLFALFHYSPAYGLGNVTLIFSLFLLGIYLGFLYERQNSLFAPIGLHATFNIINAARILFNPESL